MIRNNSHLKSDVEFKSHPSEITSGIQHRIWSYLFSYLFSYLSLWIQHNMHIKRLLDGTRLFNTWLVCLPSSLGSLFSMLQQSSDLITLTNPGILLCLLVKCGWLSSLLDIRNAFTLSLEFTNMYSMLLCYHRWTSWIGPHWFQVCHSWRATGYLPLLLCNWPNS